MSDLPAILRAYDHATASATPAALATVVATSGSTYRRPGARMLMAMDGTRVGVVSGGCLEADVQRRGWGLEIASPPALVRYDTSTGDDAIFEFGLGCAGVVDVLIERLPLSAAPRYLDYVRHCLAQRQIGAIATVLRDDENRIAVGTRHCLGDADVPLPIHEQLTSVVENGLNAIHQVGSLYLFIEAIVPPLPLVIFGAGVDAVPVNKLARTLGWDVTLVDRKQAVWHNQFDVDRAVFAEFSESIDEIPLDARTFCVVMTHRFEADVDILARLLRSPVRYIGLLGPKDRGKKVIAQLRERGMTFTPDELAKLHSPIGLDLGGERPVEIALSIIAQIQSIATGYSAGHLKDRVGPIHKPGDSVLLENAEPVIPACEIDLPR